MTLRAHRIPATAFTALASGAGGAAAVRHLVAAQYSKHLLLVRRVVDASAGHPRANLVRRAYDLLATVEDRRPDAAEYVLRHPPIAAWARRTIRSMAGGGTAEPEGLAALAAAAAVRAGTPCTIEVPVRDAGVVLPSLGRAAVTSGTVRVTEGGAEVGGVRIPVDPHSEAPGWEGLRELSVTAEGRAFRLLIDDLDPDRAPGADNAGGRLAAAEAERWQAVLGEAWALLLREHTTVAEEVAETVRVFTPLTPPPGGHVSATSRETFGTVALSAPPDACSLAATLAHETQHAKLSALLDIVPMTLPDDGRRFYAPWRADPRPVPGLLQGAYAFLGVAAFWLRQSRAGDDGAIAEFARWRDAVQVVVDTLATSGALTDAGVRFVAGMDGTLREWRPEPIPAVAAAQAADAAEEHRARWRERNGEIPVV